MTSETRSPIEDALRHYEGYLLKACELNIEKPFSAGYASGQLAKCIDLQIHLTERLK